MINKILTYFFKYCLILFNPSSNMSQKDEQYVIIHQCQKELLSYCIYGMSLGIDIKFLNIGSMQLVNHGIPYEIISNMVGVSKRFFEMPYSEREKYMSADINSPVRYGTSYNQRTDGVFCWRDFLKLVCQPLPDVLPHCPSSPNDFR